MVVLILVTAGCTPGRRSQTGPPTTEPSAPTVFVALGGNETLNADRDDIPDDWTQLVLAGALPPGTVYVNMAMRGARVADALERQLPEARDLHPTLATIWLETADLDQGTPVATYVADLTRLVTELQAAGATRVLLLTPTGGPGDPAGGLSEQIGQVAAATGATLVRLGDTSDREDDAGQRRIADAVTAALQ